MSMNELLAYIEHGDAFITWLSETEILLTWWAGTDHHKTVSLSAAQAREIRKSFPQERQGDWPCRT